VVRILILLYSVVPYVLGGAGLRATIVSMARQSFKDVLTQLFPDPVERPTYLWVGLWFEERYLLQSIGQDHIDYRDTTGKLSPRIGRR